MTHYDERAPGLLEALQRPGDAARYHEALTRAIGSRADQGDVVLVGRGANFIIGGADAIHVRLVADMAFRIRRVMEARWVSEGPARDIIRQSDHDRAACFRHFHEADWEDPLHYHLVVNTARVGIEGVVEGLVAAARQRWPQA